MSSGYNHSARHPHSSPQSQPPLKPIPLSPDYMAAVRAVENAPWNRNGADKSWVARQAEVVRQHFTRVKRLR